MACTCCRAAAGRMAGCGSCHASDRRSSRLPPHADARPCGERSRPSSRLACHSRCGYCPRPGLSPAGWHVSLIVLGAALGWLLEPLPDFVVALLMAAAWGVADLAPMALIFGGFASSAWLVSLGAFALAVAMVQSGLLFRLALLSVQHFSAHAHWSGPGAAHQRSPDYPARTARGRASRGHCAPGARSGTRPRLPAGEQRERQHRLSPGWSATDSSAASS